MWESTTKDSFSQTSCNRCQVFSFALKGKAIQFSETTMTKELTDRSLSIVVNVFNNFLK